MVISLIGLAIFIFDIMAIVSCLKSNDTTQSKILWIILILILPVVGMILYFLLGKKK